MKCSFGADEWTNFLERTGCKTEDKLRRNEEFEEKLKLWASYRGQTLTRTGMNKNVIIYIYIYIF